MKGEALIFMIFSWMLICSLSTFCFTMLLTAKDDKGRAEGERSKEESFLPEEIT